MQRQIQWFPGHMAKTRRIIKECLPQVDIVIELVDARIPKSSKNPEIAQLLGDKPKLLVLTKATLADPALSAKWANFYTENGEKAVIIDSSFGIGIDELSSAVREILREKIERYKQKGISGRSLKAMIVGIPNVGKSSLINRLAGAKKARLKTVRALPEPSSGCVPPRNWNCWICQAFFGRNLKIRKPEKTLPLPAQSRTRFYKARRSPFCSVNA